ncbi:zona pellucida sperm-binding protein 3d.2 [Echeneis naucrates]|uniref:zona pellucida sperm-binding protein 3d.2 n=1 Tax=Echeneis naucrates TaxID=173247 RepID=UPI0011141026|nr:zona pellucida sperm-binding protein 3-like [Echeneis naucrates]
MFSVFVVVLVLSAPASGGAQRGRETPFLRLPVFVDSGVPLVEKEHFSPSRGTGQEPLPDPVRELLIPARRVSTDRPSVPGDPVRTSCRPDTMQVRVQRSRLGPGDPSTQLRLGTCPPTKSTQDYIYFDYELHMCGNKRKISDNHVTYSNILRYHPPRLYGPIRRTVPFTVPVSCYYNRYQYSYQIGYIPKMRFRKIFKAIKNRVRFIVTPRNAQWERLSLSDSYELGKPMHFEVEGPPLSQDKRLYVHSCYVTPEKSHISTLQFPIVENFGCMVESKDSHSRFIQYKNNAVRFSVDAFLFKGVTSKHLYMHCTMSVGSSVPSPTAKSCNYDAKAGRWVELYGSDPSVCSCCDSSCSSATSAVTKMISSKPWTIESKVKPTTNLKRKKVPTTTTTTKATAPQPEVNTEETQSSTTSPPHVEAVTHLGKVENTVRRLQWPFGGGRVAWVDLDGEKRQVKGSAVVEEEEEEEVTKPHRIFEEIFHFD